MSNEEKAPDADWTSLALILDGQVVQTMKVDDRMAAIMLSEPKVVEVPEGLNLTSGDIYNEETGKFTRPEQIQIIPAQELN